MTFVHGVVRMQAPPGHVDGELSQMLAAVPFPWSRTDREVREAGAMSCGLAASVAPSDPSTSAALATLDTAGVSVAADLLVDDPAALRTLAGGRDGTVAELIATAYQELGDRLAERVSGDGVVLIWDHRRRRIICWRDVAGTRPLYYHLSPDRTLTVSSDLRSLVAHPSVPRRLDLAYAKALIVHGPSFTHPSRTLYRDVFKLPAAHQLTFDDGGLRVRPYWRATEVEPHAEQDPRVLAAQARELVGEAVARRTPDDGTVATHLSGGLDSSSIAVLAGRACGDPARLRAYSWAPSRRSLAPIEDDERPLAEAVAQAEGIALRFTDVEVADLVAHVTRDLALLPTTTLQVEMATSRHAVAGGARTLLSGWGGDELIVFNGRGLFADLARRGRLRQAHRELRARTRLHDSSVASGWRGRVLRPLLSDPLTSLLERRDGELRDLPPEVRPELMAALAAVGPLEEVGFLRERPGVRRNQISLLTDGHLQYRAEAWAAHGAALGLTYRFPLLSRPVVEFALSLPDHVYFRDGWKRWLYREAMAGVLPDEVRWHPNKQDNALARQLRLAAGATREPYHEALRARAENPFVDVDRIVGSASADARAPGDRTGAAAWLAFIDVDVA